MNRTTGTTGLLASHIVEQLRLRNQPVRVLVRPNSDRTWLKTQDVEFGDGDITDPASLKDACAGVDVVYHSAAKVGDWGPWEDFERITLGGTRDTLTPASAARARTDRLRDRPGRAGRAQAAARFVLSAMRDGQGRLMHRFCDGQAAVPGFLDDHAFLAWGLLELHQATLDPGHLDAALALADHMAARFADRERGGFFLTADDAESLALRPKDLFDAAVPSGNAVALFVLTALGRLTRRPHLEEAARTVIPAISPLASDYPIGFTYFLSALAFVTGPDALAPVSGDPEAADTTAFLAALRRSRRPGLLINLVPGPGPATVALCRDTTCLPPTGSVAELEKMLL